MSYPDTCNIISENETLLAIKCGFVIFKKLQLLNNAWMTVWPLWSQASLCYGITNAICNYDVSSELVDFANMQTPVLIPETN